jgi:hypothetical protein
MMNLLIALLTMSLGCTTIFSVPGETCSCLSYVPDASVNRKVNDALKRSGAVFSGEVTRIDTQPSGFFQGNLVVTLRVKESWKTVNSVTATVITAPVVINTGPSFSRSCGYQFEVGQSYLVYVESAAGGSLVTGLCSRTKKLADATEDL